MDHCLPPDLAHYAQYRALPRPTLSGGSTRVDAGRFRLHFTLTGEDATDPTDEDDDGVPDAVTRVLSAMQQAEAFYLGQGWPSLEDDNGYGGSEQLDVYLRSIDANGYAYPTTPADHDAVSACYIELDSGLTGTSGKLLESVAAHELHHCVQFAMTVETHAWMYESTATYEQYQAIESEELELLYGVLFQLRLAEPERALASTGDRYEYAGMLFEKYWAERGGLSEARLIRLWEELRDHPDWKEAVDRAGLKEWGTPLEGVFLDYSAWNAFACARDDGQHYGEEVIPCQVDVQVPITPLSVGEPFGLEHPRGHYTATYYSFQADGDTRPLRVRCNPPDEGMALGIRLLSVDASGVMLESAGGFGEAGEEPLAVLTQALDPAGAVILVSGSTGEDPIDVSCVAQRVPEEKVGACATAPGGSAIAALFAALVQLLRRQRR